MIHDPMCPDGLSIEHCCDVVAEIRADERAAALRDAVPLLKGILLEVEQHMDRTDYRIYKEYRKEVFVRFQAAIEALRGER